MSRVSRVLVRIIARMRTTPVRIAVSQSEAAEMVGLSLRTLQNFIRSKQIPVRKIGRRTLVEVSALEVFVSTDRSSSIARVPSQSISI